MVRRRLGSARALALVMSLYDYSTGSRRYVPLAERTFKPNASSGLIETRSEGAPSVPLFVSYTETDFPRGRYYELWRGLRGYLVASWFVAWDNNQLEDWQATHKPRIN